MENIRKSEKDIQKDRMISFKEFLKELDINETESELVSTKEFLRKLKQLNKKTQIRILKKQRNPEE